jgi:predicted aspartyl protease
MRKYAFERTSDEDLIIFTAWVNDHEIRLAIDTAATHSVIDFNVLLILGYSSQDSTGSLLVETSNGVMTVQKFQLNKFNALDKKVLGFEVMSYDFLEKGILSPYDGVLGLDFFEQTILTLDFIHQDVWLTE